MEDEVIENPDAAAQKIIDRLTATVAALKLELKNVNRALTIPAAEYVPAIPEAWTLIDRALQSTTLGDALLAELAEAQKDTARLNWLDEKIVNVIDLDDGKVIDIRGLAVRGAIDAAMSQSESGK